MEKTVSFTHEEATALLEMSLCTNIPDKDEVANSTHPGVRRNSSSSAVRGPVPCISVGYSISSDTRS